MRQGGARLDAAWRRALKAAKASAVGARLLRARHLRRLRSWTAADANLAAFYARFVRPGELCFDVGANRGNRTKVFLALGARVVAVEPQGACADVLTAAYGRHPRVTVVRAALGAREGEADDPYRRQRRTLLPVARLDARRRTSGRFPDEGWTASERVPLTTLDALASRYGAPEFVKIDVEGYELEVVRGMSALPACLSFELTTPECLASALACIDRLDSLGAPVYNYSLGESMRLAVAGLDERQRAQGPAPGEARARLRRRICLSGWRGARVTACESMLRRCRAYASARLSRAIRRTVAGRRLVELRRGRALTSWTAADARLAEFYSPLVSAGDVCFDIGANWGARAKIFLALGARVVAVEPQTACACFLANAFADEPAVEVVQAAAGAQPGRAVLSLADYDGLSSLSSEWIMQ